MKKCTKCKEIKSKSEFSIRNASKDGLRPNCKDCNAKYNVWKNMKDRCYNPENNRYHDWGGRGITVCDEWLLFKDMEPWIEEHWRPGLQIDRIDNNGNYCHDNCRFVTVQDNNLNRRPYGKSKYRGVSFDKHKNKWNTLVYINSKKKNIGYFNTEIQAARAYDIYVILHNLPNKLNGLNKIL